MLAQLLLDAGGAERRGQVVHGELGARGALDLLVIAESGVVFLSVLGDCGLAEADDEIEFWAAGASSEALGLLDQGLGLVDLGGEQCDLGKIKRCLLYTSDAADE